MRDDHNIVGVLGLMANAANRAETDYQFSLNGDLNQMATQGDALRANGFDVRHSDVYPCVRTEDDFKRALKLFWDRETLGWWHYRERMIQYGICTDETWKEKLEAYCVAHRSH